jgi:lipoprotein-anchoring transpeptidase ErfK/SrfK
MCRISPGELAPISQGHPDKWIRISREDQRLTCFEGEKAVFATPISSGAPGTVTPRGEHRIHLKRHTSRMIGGTGDDYYDLPGVAFPVYFTPSACAVHGCYWHNDFVRPHSHGCVNVTDKAAQWVFRWTDPVIPYDTFQQPAARGEGTTIIVV